MKKTAKFKVGIFGCGEIAGGYDLRLKKTKTTLTHAKAIRESASFVLDAICDLDPKKRNLFQKNFGPKHSFESHEALLNSAPIDVAVICTPNETHFPLAIAALERGCKAVVCEKPISLNPDEATKILALAEAKGAMFLVNYGRRWSAAFELVGKRILSGSMGEFLGGNVRYTKGLIHNGSHAINLLDFWLGGIKVESVHSKFPFSDRDDGYTFFSRTKDGAKIYFEHFDHKNFNFFEFSLVFEKGKIELTPDSTLLVWRKTTSKIQKNTHILTLESSFKQSTADAMTNLYKNLSEGLLKNKPLKMPAGDALTSIVFCQSVKNLGGQI